MNKQKWTPYLPLFVCGGLSLFFFLLFPHLMIKTDDGNFLGIALDPAFSFRDFLTDRYTTISGRTVGEFLTMVFLRVPLIFWRVASAALLTFVTWFIYTVCVKFTGGHDRSLGVFCGCLPFLMIVTCLNPAAVWVSGSFTYLWPFAGLTLCLSAPLFAYLDKTASPWWTIVSFLAAPLAVAQEQAAAATLFLYLVLAVCLFKDRIAKRRLALIPALPLLLCAVSLFASPGAHRRVEVEAAGGFDRFFEMGVFGKLFCGLSNFFAEVMGLSVFLLAIFIALLTYTAVEDKKKRRILLWSALALVVLLSLVPLLLEKALPFAVVQAAFTSGTYPPSLYILCACGALLCALLLCLTALVCRKNAKLGVAVLTCLAAGFGCALAMSFSSSIFASGQRVYFFTEMFIGFACALLFASLEDGKVKRLLFGLSCAYAAVFFTADCVALRFFEMPFMG